MGLGTVWCAAFAGSRRGVAACVAAAHSGDDDDTTTSMDRFGLLTPPPSLVMIGQMVKCSRRKQESEIRTRSSFDDAA